MTPLDPSSPSSQCLVQYTLVFKPGPTKPPSYPKMYSLMQYARIVFWKLQAISKILKETIKVRREYQTSLSAGRMTMDGVSCIPLSRSAFHKPSKVFTKL